MRRVLLMAGILVLLALLLAACRTEPAAQPGEDDLLAEIQRRGTVRISTDPNYEPQSFLTAAGEFQGFDIDVAREIASRLGVEVEFVTPDWDLITAGNWGDRWDMSVGSMTITTAREQVLMFARPAYYYTPSQFAAANDSNINSLADIAGETVCVGSATTYELWLQGDFDALGLPQESFYADPPPNVTIYPLSTDSECVQAIQAGRREFQVFLTSDTVVNAAMAQGVQVRKVGSPVYSEELAVAFDRNASREPSSLAQRVGEIIREMHNDGTLTRFSLQWFGEDLTQDPRR
jgi:polar amino acid transport system substrate-binding protein